MTLYRPRIRGLRQLRIQPSLVMRNDHKDHQQHQENINQRNDIRLRRNTTLTTNQHSHESPRKDFPARELSHPANEQNGNYWPASSLAVIKPILSIPAPRMISMARATSLNITSLSPLTKAIFSARSLKISSMRGPRRSQVVSSWLILSLPLLAIWTTTVLFSSSTFCCWFGEGCGTSVSKPLGTTGEMTMKIMLRTRRISISGTTLGDESAPPLSPPT